MGVLGNQPKRDLFWVQHDQLDAFLQDASELAKKHATTIETVIEARKVPEMDRRNTLLTQAGDSHDEHMGGFGQLLSRIAEALESRE
jgi:hypothetical protein